MLEWILPGWTRGQNSSSIPRDSAELGVLARGKWSPLIVGSSEGVARIWTHLACRDARGTTRVQDRVRTPRWRTGRMVPDAETEWCREKGLYVRVKAGCKTRREIVAPRVSRSPSTKYTTPAADCASEHKQLSIWGFSLFLAGFSILFHSFILYCLEYTPILLCTLPTNSDVSSEAGSPQGSLPRELSGGSCARHLPFLSYIMLP